MTILSLKTGHGAKSIIKCDACGAEYEMLTYTCKNSQHHFCNLECKAQYHSKRETHIESQYHKDRQLDHKDAKLKKQQKVKKRCMKCKTIYWGPPGNFPKNRDPDLPEPGLCPLHQIQQLMTLMIGEPVL